MGAAASAGVETHEENPLKGDLARLLGIHGKTLKVFGHEVQQVYLLVGGILALLWVSKRTDIIQMIMFAFMLYIMYNQYQKSQSQSQSSQSQPGDGSSGGRPFGSGGGGSSGPVNRGR